jgi:hypothetical protein
MKNLAQHILEKLQISRTKLRKIKRGIQWNDFLSALDKNGRFDILEYFDLDKDEDKILKFENENGTYTEIQYYEYDDIDDALVLIGFYTDGHKQSKFWCEDLNKFCRVYFNNDKEKCQNFIDEIYDILVHPELYHSNYSNLR